MVLILIDHADGQVKKASYEALTYGADVAKQLGTQAEGLLLGSVTANLSELGKYGVSKVHQVNNAALDTIDALLYAKTIAEAVTALGAKVIVLSHGQTGKAVAPLLAAKLKAGLVTGVVSLPKTDGGFVVKKSVFSGKAFANVEIKSDIKIVSINPNSYKIVQGEGSAEVSQLNIAVGTPTIKLTNTNKVKGEIPLTEAEVVVSGGRGLKGPENWGM